MILLAILLLTLALLILFTVFAVSVGGTAFIIIFADVIVCGVILTLIIKKIIEKKKNS